MVVSAPLLSLLERYQQKFPASRQRFETAKNVFPSGVTHDLRFLDPFPLYIDEARSSRKWDIEGNEFIDYWSGHGAMILGHSHSLVVAAVRTQVERQTHAGGCHEHEVEWGQLVQQLVPSAERVRFTASGTEATLMALRLARIFTGKPKLLKFAGHFHGWHDFVVLAADPPYESPSVPGLPNEVSQCTTTIMPNDLNLVEETLKNDPQIGAVILEPTGGHWGTVPIRGAFLRGLRDITTRLDRLLIFDEVITGFRVAPGGAQAYYNVKPDLTTLAKIVAGGLPGGCLAGRADILNYIESRPGKPKMKHPGTYNANPLSAAAGIAALKQIATGEPTAQANAMGRLLRNKLNAMFAENDLPFLAYGDFSLFRILPNYNGLRPAESNADNDGFIPHNGDLNSLDGPKSPSFIHAFRRANLLEGVDFPTLGGWMMAAHTLADIDRTVQAVSRAVENIRAEGM